MEAEAIISKEDDNNFIVLKGLEGNSPASERTFGQELVAPYLDTLIIFWWAVWGLMLVTLVIKYLIMPFIRKKIHNN